MGEPYHMYVAIQDQPARLAEVLAANGPALDRAAELLRGQRLLYLCGMGTSLHAALVGEHLLSGSGDNGLLARAVQSFDFVCYPPPVLPATAVLVVSYRGSKTYSMRALEQARRCGAATVVLTGRDVSEGMGRADVVLTTIAQEKRAPHTVSYTTALFLIAALALRMGRPGHESRPSLDSTALGLIPEAMRGALGVEAQVRKLARALLNHDEIVFLGGGPNTATAYEASLKMKETNYARCEGIHVEQFFHGAVVALSERVAVWVIAPPGESYPRCVDAVRAAKTIGATTIASVEDSDAEIATLADHVVRLAAVPEGLTPLVHVVPLQLLSYHLALAKGTDPDSFHLDDPRHLRARDHYSL